MTKRSTRFDKGELRKAERTPQGFLRAPAFATRTGVFAYRDGNGGVRRELRHPDDVFDPASLATLAGVPTTDDHPNLTDPDVMLLTPANVRKYMVGYTGDDVAQDDRFVTVSVTVTDADMIAAVEGGKVEVSCGYTCDHEEIPGVYEGQPYDIRQRHIVYNHLAHVDRGRAGPDVRLRLDAADAVQVEIKPSEDLRPMETITLNGVDYQVTAEVKAAIEKALQDAADKAKAEAPAPKVDEVPASEDKDKLQAKVDSLTAELAKARAATKTDSVDPARVREAVRARTRLELVAVRVLPKAEAAKLDAMDDKALKVAVIKAEHKSAVLDGKSDAYIEARFDSIAEGIDLATAAGERLGRDLSADRLDGGDVPDADAARQRSMAAARDAWKPKAKA